MAAFDAWLRRWWHTSVRGVLQFVLVAAVFICAAPTPRSLLYGGIVSVLGLLLRLWSSGYGLSGGLWYGPFRLLRHPHLLGSILLFLGLCLAGRSAPVMALGMVALTMLQAKAYQRTDAVLAAELGPTYAGYRAEVPALLPRLWPHQAGPGPRPRFAWRQALLQGRHRELDGILALGLAWVILYGLCLVPSQQQTHGVVAAVVLMFIGLRFVYYAGWRRRRY